MEAISGAAEKEGRGHDGSEGGRERGRAPFQDSFPLLLHRIRDQRGMKRRRRRKPAPSSAPCLLLFSTIYNNFKATHFTEIRSGIIIGQ